MVEEHEEVWQEGHPSPHNKMDQSISIFVKRIIHIDVARLSKRKSRTCSMLMTNTHVYTQAHTQTPTPTHTDAHNLIYTHLHHSNKWVEAVRISYQLHNIRFWYGTEKVHLLFRVNEIGRTTWMKTKSMI